MDDVSKAPPSAWCIMSMRDVIVVGIIMIS